MHPLHSAPLWSPFHSSWCPVRLWDASERRLTSAEKGQKVTKTRWLRKSKEINRQTKTSDPSVSPSNSGPRPLRHLARRSLAAYSGFTTNRRHRILRDFKSACEWIGFGQHAIESTLVDSAVIGLRCIYNSCCLSFSLSTVRERFVHGESL